jgi:hypothetical protein
MFASINAAALAPTEKAIAIFFSVFLLNIVISAIAAGEIIRNRIKERLVSLLNISSNSKLNSESTVKTVLNKNATTKVDTNIAAKKMCSCFI